LKDRCAFCKLPKKVLSEIDRQRKRRGNADGSTIYDILRWLKEECSIELTYRDFRKHYRGRHQQQLREITEEVHRREANGGARAKEARRSEKA